MTFKNSNRCLNICFFVIVSMILLFLACPVRNTDPEGTTTTTTESTDNTTSTTKDTNPEGTTTTTDNTTSTTEGTNPEGTTTTTDNTTSTTEDTVPEGTTTTTDSTTSTTEDTVPEGTTTTTDNTTSTTKDTNPEGTTTTTDSTTSTTNPKGTTTTEEPDTSTSTSLTTTSTVFSGMIAAGGGVVDGQDWGGHSLAIDSNGNLWAWGDNGYGQLGYETDIYYQDTPKLIQIEGVTKFKAVAAGGLHSLAIDSTGKLWAWGYNSSGQVGDGTGGNYGDYQPTPQEIEKGTKFKAVAAGVEYSLAIDETGQLWAWGNNESSQLGDGTKTNQKTPQEIEKGTKFRAVAAGFVHSLAIDSTGKLWTWGTIGIKKFGIPDVIATPQEIGNGTKFKAIAAGGLHSLAIDGAGGLWTWGLSSDGQLGDGNIDEDANSINYKKTPTKIENGTKFKAVAAGERYSLAIDETGELLFCGNKISGQLVKIKEGIKFKAVASGKYYSLAIDEEESKLWSWGRNDCGQLGDGTIDEPSDIVVTTTPKKIIGGPVFK